MSRKNISACFCKAETDLEYLSTKPRCSDDYAAVCALPEQWIPRRSGHILGEFLKQREKSHQNIYEDLLKDAKVVNENIDNNVRKLAENLLAEIRQNQLDIDCIVEKCSSTENPLSVDERTNTMTKINILLSRRILALTNFKLEAFTLERERSAKLKSTLQLHFHRAITMGHKPPKELLHEFDEKIYDINQQLMSNSRTYMTLEAKLRSQADECLVQARTKLNGRMFLETKVTSRTQSALPWSREQKNSFKGTANISQGPNDSVHISAVQSQSKLIEEYREAIINMFTAISGQFEDLHREIEDRNDIARQCSSPAITGLQKIIEKAIYSLEFSTVSNDNYINCDFTEISRITILNMQKSLSIFGENLKHTYIILHDAGHIWDAHMIRLALAQKLTMASVEDFIVSHDVIELGNEVLTDIALEQLRAAPDSDKIQQYYDAILVALDRTTDLYKQHSEIEVGKLEEFTNLTSPLSNTLIAEYNVFLENNPRSPLPEIKSVVNTPTAGSPKNSNASRRLPVSKAIFQTEIQNVALYKWRNGFLESFEGNLPMVSGQLSQQAQLWVDERRDILRMRHSLKLMSHSIRKERIRVARDIRLTEVRYHEARLDSHLDAIYDLVDNLPAEASEYLSLDSPELYPLGRWLSNIQTDMNELFARDPLDPEVKRLKMCSYASRLLKHRQHFTESLDSALEEYKKSVAYRVQVARISNIRFMSQLQLFSEGGRYAATEAVKACTTLVRGADSLEACFSRTLDCIHHRRSQLLVLADQLISPIHKMVEEVLKSAPKGMLDRKKFATVKK